MNLLRPQEVKLVVDVRSIPRSLTNPQYNAARFADALSECEIGYERIPELGGLRGRGRDVPANLNAFWENRSFHNYADYAMSDEFRSGLAGLRKLGHGTTSAIMCAEAVWWRCHRRIITDYLITAGETVFHILGDQSRSCQHLSLERLCCCQTARCPIRTLLFPEQNVCSKALIEFVCLNRRSRLLLP